MNRLRTEPKRTSFSFVRPIPAVAHAEVPVFGEVAAADEVGGRGAGAARVVAVALPKGEPTLQWTAFVAGAIGVEIVRLEARLAVGADAAEIDLLPHAPLGVVENVSDDLHALVARLHAARVDVVEEDVGGVLEDDEEVVVLLPLQRHGDIGEGAPLGRPVEGRPELAGGAAVGEHHQRLPRLEAAGRHVVDEQLMRRGK